jgi:Rod binding domain-containing protein
MSLPISSSTPVSAAGAGGLPVVNQALEPASVRNGSPAVQKAYATALDFEQMLVSQLSQSLTASRETGEEGSEGGSEGSSEASALAGGSANSELSSMLPQALSEGVMSQGGLGLAQQLMGDFDSSAASAQQASGAQQAAGTQAVGGQQAAGTQAASSQQAEGSQTTLTSSGGTTS